MKLRRTELNRRQIKSSEGELIWELENSYALSPKLSSLIMMTAKECLLKEYSLKEGQIEVTVIGIEERSGKVIEKMEKKKVRLTIDNGIEDMEILKEYGRINLRQIKIERITEEAIDQGGVLSQEDLSKYLSCTVRTIQRDIKAIKQKGIEVVTRGYLHNIGRGQTHKVKIIGMYLDGKTYSEIKLNTRHSVGAIKRYLESFTKVVMAQSRGIYRIKDISAVTGISETLVKQYTELIKESKKDKTRKENLGLLIERSSYREGVKKTIKLYSKPQAAMMRGLL
jgi:type I site-specific restriction-modification system R (restriction) subunit